MPFNALNHMIGMYLMGFVIFVSGVGALGIAIAYAIRPTEGKLALMRPLSLASIFAALCSFMGGLIVVLQGIAATPTFSLATFSAILMGFSETLTPLFVAFAFLSVAWILVAVGLRRHES